ncbi:ribosomal RNA small subunit methyltransferase H [Planctomycetales bacterium]|nr:ribosomal RNA small subunit methyltransferase H [Planctomycetales bacterium]
MSDSVHIPVLLDEVIELLNPQSNGIYVDGTLGGGGHSEAILRSGTNITVIGMDRDKAAIDRTEQRLKLNGVISGENRANGTVRFVHADYRFFGEALDMLGIEKIDGFLADLGLSSDQLADRNRGFSFDSDGDLDLRFDISEGLSAAEWLAKLPEEAIADLIYGFGEERFSRRIARKIVERRENGKPVRKANELAELVRSCVPKERNRRNPIDPATRTFQALRIAVNRELDTLEQTLKTLPQRMKPDGVIAVISFHSLEDRIVKNVLRENEHWKVITKKPIVASEEEIQRNARSRSAKLRGAKYVKTG